MRISSNVPMTHIHAAHLHHQRKRFMRPDAHRFLRPDWRRFMWFGQEHQLLYQLYDRIERKYSSNQPRVPRGNPDGGQWTSDGRVRNGRQDPRILSDVTSDRIDSGTQYAQSRTRGAFGRVVINGQRVEPSPAQQVRLTVVEAQAREAIRRVQELDPKWQPAPSAYESVEGLIAAYQADARQAQQRISELQQVGIRPGPFAGESIPARGPERDFSAAERREINRIGSEKGCHTCGITNPGTPLENFVIDHQPPTAWNPLSRSQRLYPQCISCSSKQGNWISRNGGRR
jgi:hypothetical protein